MTADAMTGLTSPASCFEHFRVGQVMRHARGKTIDALENVLLTHLSMNSAPTHFDEHAMQGTKFGRRAVYGGITASIVIGLTSEDTAENALAELGMTAMRLKAPVHHGDTLYAYTEVLAVEDAAGRDDAGIVTFRHWGENHRQVLVFECVRRVLVRRAPR
jgi:itaconyl-CoA hydratase